MKNERRGEGEKMLTNTKRKEKRKTRESKECKRSTKR